MDTDRDGIDIDCCRNTMVSNCRINSPNDDALCPKSTYALGEIRPTENLTIVNCQVSGFAEGTLLDGTMKPSKVHNGRINVGFTASDLRPAAAFVDVVGLEIDNFKAQLADGVFAAKYEDVKGRVVRNSPVLDEAKPQ